MAYTITTVYSGVAWGLTGRRNRSEGSAGKTCMGSGAVVCVLPQPSAAWLWAGRNVASCPRTLIAQARCIWTASTATAAAACLRSRPAWQQAPARFLGLSASTHARGYARLPACMCGHA
eukprot:349929-Chlamydomonas_euryale.AAC.5